MRRTLNFVFVIGMISLFVPLHAAKADEYERPSLARIIQSMIRFKAIDIHDDAILDIFARTNACATYMKYYPNEFQWQQIRPILRDKIREDVATFPTGYRYDVRLQLDRYDFERKVYPFITSVENESVNAFAMVTHPQDFCEGPRIKNFPDVFRLVINPAIKIPSLPLNEQEGAELFERMNKNGNKSHFVHLRFNIRVEYIASVSSPNPRLETAAEKNQSTAVKQKVMSSAVAFDSRLDSIEYYEDADRTKLIYIYRP